MDKALTDFKTLFLDGTATWDLLDRRGSTVADAAGGSITQLSAVVMLHSPQVGMING